MPIYYDEKDDIIFEHEGKKYDVSEGSYYCESCGDHHTCYSIDEIGYEAGLFVGDLEFEKDQLEKEILEHLRERNPT